MKILSISTSQMAGGVGLVVDGDSIGEIFFSTRKTHSRRLMTHLLFLLKEAGMSWDDIDHIAVDQGPGSFTGLRIGVATAKGLCVSMGYGLVGVSSLDIMAEQALLFSGLILPMIDARKGQVYGALYRNDGKGRIEKLHPPSALYPDQVCSVVQKAMDNADHSVLVAGDGFSLCEKQLRTCLKDRLVLAPAHYGLVRPAMVGVVAHGRLLSGVSPVPCHELLPEYCRLSEAEEKLLHNTGAAAQ